MTVLRSRELAIAQACALVKRAAELSGAWPDHPADCFCAMPGEAAVTALIGAFGGFDHDTAGMELIARLLDAYEASKRGAA